MSVNKECSCYYTKSCKINKEMKCSYCKEEGFDKLFWHSETGYDYECLCEKCKKKRVDILLQEEFKQALFYLKTDKIHCIKCKKELSHKDLGGNRKHYSDVDRSAFTCPKCKFIFTLWYGEPDDDYYP